MVTFNGFFFSAGTNAEEDARLDALKERWPDFIEGGNLTQAGVDTTDPEFDAAYHQVCQEIQEKTEKSFCGQNLCNAGTLLVVKALPGGSNFQHYGEALRTYVLGGRILKGDNITDSPNIANDDFVVSYKDLLEGLHPSIDSEGF